MPFLLRPAQVKLAETFERMRRAGKPIRVILLKARQWGGIHMHTDIHVMDTDNACEELEQHHCRTSRGQCG